MTYENSYFNTQAPVADEVIFDVSKVKESSFFKSDLTDPPQIFDEHLLEMTDFSRNNEIEEKKNDVYSH